MCTVCSKLVPPPPPPTPQALRLPRALRLFPQMKHFFITIFGDGARLIIVVLIVLVFLIWFAVVSMQIFGYMVPDPECERLGSDSFRDFLHVRTTGVRPRPLHLMLRGGLTSL